MKNGTTVHKYLIEECPTPRTKLGPVGLTMHQWDAKLRSSCSEAVHPHGVPNGLVDDERDDGLWDSAMGPIIRGGGEVLMQAAQTGTGIKLAQASATGRTCKAEGV